MITALESANLKLIRASEHIRAIDQYSRRYARRKPHKIITDAKGKETADIRKAPTDDIAIMAGEALYQFRLGSLGVRSRQAQSNRNSPPFRLGGEVLFPVFYQGSQEAACVQLF